jgi:hypothetical protein
VATAANGVSSPIENVGSFASVAMGFSTITTSSRLHPNAACSARSSSGSGGISIGITMAGYGSRPSRAHSPYGARPASQLFTSVSSCQTLGASGSTHSISPGPSRPRLIFPCPSTGTAPASEQQTTSPSSVRCQRNGRSPLRSSAAPTRRPSLNTTPAGPSHGSLSEAWYRK